MSSFNIKTASLPADDYARLMEMFPKLVGKGFYDYCPTCKKAGTYRWQGREWECDCAMQFQLYLHYHAAGIGIRYQRLGWGDWKGDPDILDAIQLYAANDLNAEEGVGLFLYGPNGVGKTMLATLALKEFIKRGFSCYNCTFADMIEAFTAGWKSDDDKRWFDRKFKQSQVLILDDFGRHYSMTDRLPASTFDSLLRTRVQAGRPTLFTANMTPEDVSVGYGSAALSLLREQSLEEHLRGDDYRSNSVAGKLAAQLAIGEMRPIV